MVKKDGQYWLVKTAKEWGAECHISEHGVKTAKREAKRLGLIKTATFKFNGIPTSHFALTDKFHIIINIINGILDKREKIVSISDYSEIRDLAFSKYDSQGKKYIKEKKRKIKHKNTSKYTRGRNTALKRWGKTGQKSKPSIKYKIKSRVYRKMKRKDDLVWYSSLIAAGITEHRDGTKAKDKTLLAIRAFRQQDSNPYIGCDGVPKYLEDKTWTLQELIDCFVYQKENCDKYGIKLQKSFATFVSCPNGYRSSKSWSPLIYWHKRMHKDRLQD